MDLSVNNKDIESLMLDILSDKTHNALVNVLYKLLAGQYKQFENFLTALFSRTKTCNKDIHIATTVALKTATAIDHILTNFCVDTNCVH